MRPFLRSGNNNICCFKHWKRNGFSVLISLKKIIKIGVLCLSYSLVNRVPLSGQTDTISTHVKTFEFQEVEVTGRRSHVVKSDLSRIITVITQDEIEKAGVNNLVDLLEYVSNIDIRQRGVLGVQGDISIRGSSFDHVMVLVNGVNVNDPQTGHLNLDLPIDYEVIEKIEILEGPATKSLGPGAFMGAINIITKNKNSDKLVYSKSFGENSFIRDHLHSQFKLGSVNNTFSAGVSSSSGYMHNTDFIMYNLYYNANIKTDLSNIDFQSGMQIKDFGAAGFYSPKFSDQYEENSTWFTSIKATTGRKIKISPQIYWRRKKDHFLLDRQNPEFYENFHLTNVFGSQLNFSYSAENSVFAIGFDIRSENINSNNIGFNSNKPIPVRGENDKFYTKNFGRTNFSGYLEYLFENNKVSISAGTLVNWNTFYNEGPYIFPGFDISYKISTYYRLFTSINRSLHLPTFTDLFYTDPANEGNISLLPDKLTSFELGIKKNKAGADFKSAMFYNYGKDIIDWLWSFDTRKFGPVNLERYNTLGLTSSFSLAMPNNNTLNYLIDRISINYMYLKVNKSISDSVSKYYNLKHKLSVLITQQIIKNLTLSWNISFQEREGRFIIYQTDSKLFSSVPYKSYWLIDVSAKWQSQYLDIFAEISNLLNRKYVDAGSAFQPGRWLKVGFTLNIHQ